MVYLLNIKYIKCIIFYYNFIINIKYIERELREAKIYFFSNFYFQSKYFENYKY